jgi:putative membrane protein
MVTDHTKANQELTTLAQAKHLPVATELDQKHQALAEKLATLQGAAFDRAYLAGQVADHAQTVRLFTTEAREGHDAELKAFAAQTLPTLQEHLRMVRALAPKQSGERAQPHSARAKKP